MIAIDTNILVYAHRPEMPFHDRARALFEGLPERTGYFALPWPCVHEFAAVVTNPRIFREPTPLETALDAVGAIEQSGLFRLLGEGPGYLSVLSGTAVAARTAGAMIHDARIIAICRYHGIGELWSADRNFARFAGVKVTNPLLAESP